MVKPVDSGGGVGMKICRDEEDYISTVKNVFNYSKKGVVLVEKYMDKTVDDMAVYYTFKDGKQQKAGTIGNVGTTSFFPSKNLGCYGDGGAIFTNDDKLAHTLRGIVNHGMYERYYHDVVGVNSRLDSIQAGVLKAKLPNLDTYCNARRNAARFYNNAFANHSHIITPTAKSNKTAQCNQICDVCDCHVFHQYTLKLSLDIDRSKLQEHLKTNGIPSMIYYPVPLHLQEC